MGTVGALPRPGVRVCTAVRRGPAGLAVASPRFPHRAEASVVARASGLGLDTRARASELRGCSLCLDGLGDYTAAGHFEIIRAMRQKREGMWHQLSPQPPI